MSISLDAMNEQTACSVREQVNDRKERWKGGEIG